MRAQQYDISANPNPTRPQRWTTNDRIEGADLCRLSRLRQGTAVRLGEDAADQELSSDEADGGVPARRIRTSVTIRIVARLPEIETSFSNVGQVGNLRRVVNPPTQARLPIARRLPTCPTSKADLPQWTAAKLPESLARAL